MPQTLTRLIHHLRRMAPPAELDSDADLLRRFCGDRDEAAFAALMARHGPMVYGVCRRVLRDAHAADDAFQATFLVLARKAASVGRPESLSGWLYGVAYRVSMKARGMSDTVVSEERERLDPRRDPLAELSARDLLAVLEQEVQRLPEAFRLPVVLCCLEGLSQEEACRRLGWSAGSLKGRLERGRERLRQRLMRRGLTLAAGLAAVEASRASVAAALLGPTTRAALGVAAGAWPVAGEMSQRVIALAQGGIPSMTLLNLKTAVVLLVAFGLVGSGLGWLAVGLGKERPPAEGSSQAKEDRLTRGDQETRVALVEKMKKQQQQLAAEEEHAEKALSQRLVDLREKIAEVEQQTRDAEEAVRKASMPNDEEALLREERKEMLRVKIRHQGFQRDKKEDAAEAKKETERIESAIASLEARQIREEEYRSVEREKALRRLLKHRRSLISAEEELQQLERTRGVLREESDRKREAISERIRQLEGFADLGSDGRRTRAVERKLDALQTTLDELGREVRRLRGSKRE